MNALRWRRSIAAGAPTAAEPALLEAGMEPVAAAGEYYIGRRVLATRRAKPVRQRRAGLEAGAQDA